MIPVNFTVSTVKTVNQWRALAKRYRVRSWRGAMERYAAEHGKAIAMLADDSALFVEQSAKRFHVPAERIAWHNGLRPIADILAERQAAA
jgi:hypothetical protein